jgi:hypothetical protein
MPVVKFNGYITPPLLNIELKHGPVTVQDPTMGSASIGFSITGSDIAAECDILTVNDNTMTVLHWHVIAMCGVTVDAIAFSLGIGATVIIDKCELPDGRKGPIGLKDDALKAACSVSYQDVFTIGSKEGAIFKLLQDLVVTASRPLDAPVNCARVVEGFRKLMYPIPADQEPDKGRDSREWTFMQENLNFQTSYLRFVTDLSKGPRHGHVGPMIVSDIGKTRLHAWNVTNRFLEFRKRGNMPLPKSDFTLL